MKKRRAGLASTLAVARAFLHNLTKKPFQQIAGLATWKSSQSVRSPRLGMNLNAQLLLKIDENLLWGEYTKKGNACQANLEI